MHVPFPDLTTFVARVGAGQRLPVVVDVAQGDLLPHEVYERFRERFGRAILLESAKGASRSFICRGDGRTFSVADDMIGMPDGTVGNGDPFEAIRSITRVGGSLRNDRLDSFSGGYVGYIAYDMARHIERLPEIAATNPTYPDCQLICVESFCVIDHERRMMRFVASRSCDDGDAASTYRDVLRDIDAMIDATTSQPSGASPASSGTAPAHDSSHDRVGPTVANRSQREFENDVLAAKAYIRAGDIFQVNLSVRFEREFLGDPLALYKVLRSINPAPYMALLEFDDVSIVSASPELLVRVQDRVVETRPIAGTRPRGADEAEDARYARKLADNEKERAEHLMLVDLERNDIGRVARYGSIHVDELMGIERYSHVIHIVSHIRGELDESRDTVDAIRACFPGGTITGAPKVRSMEIIEELEPHRRGIYTGSVGWIGFGGDAELSIAIRTIVIAGGIAYAQAGAGIVADSQPEHEYMESVRKARAAIEAIEMVSPRC